MKGLLDQRGMMAGGGVDGGTGGRYPFPREWTVVVNRVEGTVVRFMAGGVDLIEPGAGETSSSNQEGIYCTLEEFRMVVKITLYFRNSLLLSSSPGFVFSLWSVGR